MRHIAGALMVVCAVSQLSCGAFGDNAQPVKSGGDSCPTADERIDVLLGMLDQDKLSGLKRAMSEDLTVDLRMRLVHALLQIVDALPAGSISGLLPLVEGGSLDDALIPLADILEAASDYPALALGGKVLNQCTGKPLLATLRSLLAEPESRAALETVVGGDLDVSALLADLGIDLGQLTHKTGFQALLRAVLTSISAPGFDIGDLVGEEGLLALVIDPQDPAISALIVLLERLLLPGPRLESVRLVTSCLLLTDSNDRLTGLVFDLLASGTLLSGATPELSLYDGGILEVLDRLVSPLLGVLIDDEVSRESLVLAAGVLLREDVAARALPDIIALVREGALGGILDLVVTLDTGVCR